MTHLNLAAHGERDVRAVGEGGGEAVELGRVVSRGVGALGAAAREGPRERPRGVRHPVPDDLSQGLVEALREESAVPSTTVTANEGWRRRRQVVWG